MRYEHSLAYRRLCGLLRAWRSDAGLTQRALAKRLRQPPSYVHKTEAGERRIDALEFFAWCQECGRDPAASILEVAQAAESRSGHRPGT